jgi:hypothetical protein
MNKQLNKEEAKERGERISQIDTGKFDSDDELRAMYTEYNHPYVDDTNSHIILCEHRHRTVAGGVAHEVVEGDVPRNATRRPMTQPAIHRGGL